MSLSHYHSEHPAVVHVRKIVLFNYIHDLHTVLACLSALCEVTDTQCQACRHRYVRYTFMGAHRQTDRQTDRQVEVCRGS